MADDINAALGLTASPSASGEQIGEESSTSMGDYIDAKFGLRASPSASGDQIGEESSIGFIQKVRARTCYTTLRDLINFFSVLSGIVVVISAIVNVVKGSTDQNGLLLLLGIGGGILGMFIIIAIHQASSLLIDIADTLIEQNRKKSRGHDPSA